MSKKDAEQDYYWTPFGVHPRRRVAYTQPANEPSMTKQEFADDCDINKILSKFQITGALNHFAKWAPSYGDFSACDFQEAQNLLIRARQMFDELPSSIRNMVATPQGFLDFVNDPANADKMLQLGLREAPPTFTVPPPSGSTSTNKPPVASADAPQASPVAS